METRKMTTGDVKKVYEKKYSCKIKIHDLSTPELVMKYIEKYELCPSSAELIFSLLSKKEEENWGIKHENTNV